MCNGDLGWRVNDEILRGIAHVYGWPDWLPSRLAPTPAADRPTSPCAGVYEARPGFVIEVVDRDGAIEVRPHGQSPLRMEPGARSTYFSPVLAAEIVFERAEDGSPTALVLRQGSGPLHAKRLG